MIETKDLMTLALFGLFAAAIFMVAGAISNLIDAKTAPAGPAPDLAPPGYMVDDLLNEARDITRRAAEDGTGPR